MNEGMNACMNRAARGIKPVEKNGDNEQLLIKILELSDIIELLHAFKRAECVCVCVYAYASCLLEVVARRMPCRTTCC